MGKMMRKGADAFLRLRKKAQARKEAEGTGNSKVVADAVDPSVEQIRASRGSVIQKRARRRSSVNILTGGLFGLSTADDDDDDDDDDDATDENEKESIQGNKSAIGPPKAAASPKASKPSFLT